MNYFYFFFFILAAILVLLKPLMEFIKNTFNKVRELNKIRNDKNYSFLIEIDGGVNLQNSKELVNLGADVLVAGSFVFKSENSIETIKKLKQC